MKERKRPDDAILKKHASEMYALLDNAVSYLAATTNYYLYGKVRDFLWEMSYEQEETEHQAKTSK